MVLSGPSCWILFHSKEEFEDEYRLRDWLAGTLKKDRNGSYFLNRRFGISPGSILLFERNGFLVGSAIAKEEIRTPTDEEKAQEGGYRFVLKIVPDSIWIWREPFVSLKAVKGEGVKIPVGIPSERISASDVLRIFSIVCQTNVG
jgi:hypothetical protein